MASARHLLYSLVRHAEPARWAVDGCDGPHWALTGVVPRGFASYARIFLPGREWRALAADDPDPATLGWSDDKQRRATPVRWDEAARLTGKPMHRSMQWHEVAPAPTEVVPDLGYVGYSAPPEGELTGEILAVTFGALAELTAEDQPCICAFWEGFGNLDHLRGRAARVEGIGQQGHLLLTASFGAVRDQWSLVLKHVDDSAGLTPQAVWPTTREWYFAVPFEMHSCFLGGPADVVQKVLDAPALESCEVFPGDQVWLKPGGS